MKKRARVFIGCSSQAQPIGEAIARSRELRARAVVALMRTLAVEEGPVVAANAIACGPLAGDALHQARVRGLRAQRGLDTAAAEAALAAALPLGRLAEPADVAATAAWLLGPAAAGITGQVLAVAGGGELQVWP